RGQRGGDRAAKLAEARHAREEPTCSVGDAALRCTSHAHVFLRWSRLHARDWYRLLERLLCRPTIPCQQGGASRCQCVADWYAAPARMHVASSWCLATSCSEIGRPLALRPQG